MKIGILGSGVVGQTLGTKLARNGHDIVLGTRDPAKLDDGRGMGGSLRAWLDTAGDSARIGTFAEAAAHGALLINATAGTVSLDALRLAGADNLSGKILIDVANPLDFSRGMPPSLTICNTDSLGEQIQAAFPDARVVKALNTTTASVMVDPTGVARGEHDLFVCGNDAAAKAEVTDFLKREFGWKYVIDVGDITTARGTEMLLPLWVRLYGAFGSPAFNFHIAR
jgi:8-hydroxy-5-deazaflavin:NADPH oxidoreductase